MERMSVPGQTSVGDLRRLSVTLPQAAHILRIDVDRVRRAVDRRIVLATLVRQGKRQVRTLDGVDVLCLRMEGILKAGIRQDLYARLKGAPDRTTLDTVFRFTDAHAPRTETQPLLGFLNESAAATVADMTSLDAAAGHVDDRGRIHGADVEAHRIAALVEGGTTADDVIADYPDLGAEQIAAALAYARANPKPGRPYPPRTVKSVLKAGGGGGLAAAFAAARGDRDDP